MPVALQTYRKFLQILFILAINFYWIYWKILKKGSQNSKTSKKPLRKAPRKNHFGIKKRSKKGHKNT